MYLGVLQALEDPSPKEDVKGEKAVKVENMTLEKLEDFAELVTSYRCRVCPFTTTDQQELILHFKLQHVQVNETFCCVPDDKRKAWESQ